MVGPQHVLRGVIAAMVTPMREDEELDLAAVPGLVEHLLEREGVHGLLVLGSRWSRPPSPRSLGGCP